MSSDRTNHFRPCTYFPFFIITLSFKLATIAIFLHGFLSSLFFIVIYKALDLIQGIVEDGPRIADLETLKP